MPDPIDTIRTDAPICPYCGKASEYEAASLWQPAVERLTCDACGKDFVAHQIIEAKYTTSKIEEPK